MTAPSSENPIPERTPRFGLSAKLLLLTTLFVMVAEVLIYVPSIANFRLNWLADRLAGKPFANEYWFVRSNGTIEKTTY